MDLQQLRKQLKEKEKQLKEQQKNQIIHLEFHGISKEEAYNMVNLKQSFLQRQSIVQQFIILKKGQKELFMNKNQNISFQRYFNKKLSIDLRAKDELKPIDKPCLIIVNGNKKSKRKEIIQECQKGIIKLLDKRREDGSEILVSIFGFHNQSMIDLLTVYQDFGKVLHSNLKLFKDRKIVKTKNLIQIAMNNLEELQQVMNLYKCVKKLIEEQANIKFKEIVFQFIRAEVEDNKLTQFWDKCNIIQLCNDIDEKQFYLKQCLEQLEKNEQINYHNCKLTESISDCLQKDYLIYYIGCIITDQTLESQLSVLQYLDSISLIKSKITYEQKNNTMKDLLGSKYEI